jgi:hypothetical protein
LIKREKGGVKKEGRKKSKGGGGVLRWEGEEKEGKGLERDEKKEMGKRGE